MSESVYQFFVFTILVAWLVPLVLIWVRYDALPHSKTLFTAILALPCLLFDNLLAVLKLEQPYAFLIGAFDFVPVLVGALLFLAVRKLVVEHRPGVVVLLFTPVVLFAVGEIAFLLLNSDVKVMLNQTSPNAQLTQYWPIYTYHCLLGVAVLVIALRIESMVNNYQTHLSDQVVDVDLYKMSGSLKLFGVLITVSFASLVVILAVAFGALKFSNWMLTADVVYYLVFYCLVLVLLRKTRYSPSPLNYRKLKKHDFSPDQMQQALNKASEVVVSAKLYKVVGLRLRHVADKAGVDPQLLAVASRELINRNFRAFIYHYRLEYAKNVLMRTDAKVSAVAKRLGFTSEKFLSDTFIKYVEMMGKQRPELDENERKLLE